MFVMGKLDRELPEAVRIGERRTRVITRRNFCVAASTDYRAGILKELLAVAAHTGLMIRVIGYVRKISYLLPVRRRRLMAGVTGLLVLLGGMRELRVVDRGRSL